MNRKRKWEKEERREAITDVIRQIRALPMRIWQSGFPSLLRQ